jgi:crotonobetainyl-CoA:carnitine CoA-transferase CaiB-like acyl-CoA transferase
MIKSPNNQLPLQGITVIELGTIIAGPFAGSLLAEMGATVIKIEQPVVGDGLRQSGPKINGVPIWWGVASRNKKCISLNLKNPLGIEIFKKLIQKADVLIENYRPGVLDKLGIGSSTLHALVPKLIILSISGYGQDGSYATKPGFGKIAEGLSGIIPLTGKPDEPPLYTGFSLADASSGLCGSFMINMLLLDQERKDIHIDLALYEPLLEMLAFQFHSSNSAPIRQGTNNPRGWGIPTNPIFFPTFQSIDHQWFQIKLDPKNRSALINQFNLSADIDIVNALRDWSVSKTIQEIFSMFGDLGVEVSIVQNGETLAANPYFTSRGDVIQADHPSLGQFPVPGFFPKFERSHQDIAFRAPQIGEDNAYVMKDFLNIDDDQYQLLIDQHII